MNSYYALSPLDGRYSDIVTDVRKYFSEAALIKYRIQVEIEYLLMLNDIEIFSRKLTIEEISNLKNLYLKFTDEYLTTVKSIEHETHHDVKAIEYFIRKHCSEDIHNMIHFGLTSEDINSTSYMLMMHDFMEKCFTPILGDLRGSIVELSESQYVNIPMLSLTHGQPAITTTMTKELRVFIDRIIFLCEELEKIPYQNKLGGAVGTLAGHYQTFPEIDWFKFMENFNEKLGLKRIRYTTQVNNYDSLSCRLNYIKQINTVLIDFARDIWSYVSRGLFKQSVAPGQVGSSTMPQKINPINFENAEGNLQISNALLNCLTECLPVSRMQRDLSGSTQIRNLGSALGYAVIAYKNLTVGIKKLNINKQVIENELKLHTYSIIMEPIQLILRKHNITNAYEICRDFAHEHQSISSEQFTDWVKSLKLSDEVTNELLKIDMDKYLGFM